VPLSTVTFATLAPRFRTQGTALFSLMRNIGSSIGISLMTLLLTRNTTIMHAELAEHISPANAALRYYARELDLHTPAGRALLDQEVTAQAAAVAYADDFRLMFYVVLALVPLALLVGTAHSTVPPRRP
jgi:MFS transporter, DHA2 family, multidrug resistance protein